MGLGCVESTAIQINEIQLFKQVASYYFRLAAKNHFFSRILWVHGNLRVPMGWVGLGLGNDISKWIWVGFGPVQTAATKLSLGWVQVTDDGLGLKNPTHAHLYLTVPDERD